MFLMTNLSCQEYVGCRNNFDKVLIHNRIYNETEITKYCVNYNLAPPDTSVPSRSPQFKRQIGIFSWPHHRPQWRRQAGGHLLRAQALPKYNLSKYNDEKY